MSGLINVGCININKNKQKNSEFLKKKYKKS